MIFFSIIIPTYNRKNELVELLNCLVNQTYKNFEVIICDDGSTDGTKNVLEYFTNDLDIQYFELKNSGGPASPRNHGIINSKYEWLCFLDSDDLWTKSKLEILSNIIENSSEKIFCHPVQVFGNNYNKIEIIGRYKKGLFLTDFKTLLYNGNKIVNSSLCVNKNIITAETLYNIDPNFHGIEDYIFVLNLTHIGYNIKLINNVLGFYRIHDNNISSDSHKQLKKLQLFFDGSNYQNISMKMIASQLKYIDIDISNYNKLKCIKLYSEVIFGASSIEIKIKSFFKLFLKLFFLRIPNSLLFK